MTFRELAKTSLLCVGSVVCHNKNSKIIYYHDVCGGVFYESPDTEILQGTPIETFKKHIEIIKKNGYTIVPVIHHPKFEIAIMFDDGYRGIWDNRQFFFDSDIKPTVFIAVDLIGKPSFLTKEEILELQKHGFIFQCHTWSHVSLADMSQVELKKELGDSKDYLTEMLGKEVTEICLPLGYYSDTLIGELKKYGYKKVYSSVPGCSSDKVAAIMETRNFCQTATPSQFKMIINGGLDMLRKRYIKLHYRVK